MKKIYTFPFGEKVEKLTQKDQSPKKVFVLGVYASAVHARWVDANGKQIVAALAVASEPEIFWKGEDAEAIIKNIHVPERAGKLMPANSNLNGPSGNSLDDLFLSPLKITRKDAWLCDLLPESRVNVNQRKVIDEFYRPIAEKLNLPKATIPDFDKEELKSTQRRLEILEELKKSKANTIVLLGDLPIQYFISHFDNRYKKLSDFGDAIGEYGRVHEITIDGQKYNVIPLCHPRQASRLGASSAKWFELHKAWITKKM